MADRTEDMGTIKRLKVTRDGSGDVIVSIVTGRGMAMHDRSLDLNASVEFTFAGNGGGSHSPRTFDALLALQKAMEEDEVARPDRHRPEDHF